VIEFMEWQGARFTHVVVVLLGFPLSTCASGTCAKRFVSWQLCASSRCTQQAVVSDDYQCMQNGASRITLFAGEAFSDLGSTSQGKRAAKQSRLVVNGEIAHMNLRVEAGDTVELLPTGLQSLTSLDVERDVQFSEGLVRSGSLCVAHEEDGFAVVHKPAGIHSKPYGAASSLEHALPGVLTPPVASDALLRPTCVHRLDKRVSGLIVVAKTRSAAAFLSKAFSERTVKKRYRALVLGAVDLPPQSPLDKAWTGSDRLRVVSDDGADSGNRRLVDEIAVEVECSGEDGSVLIKSTVEGKPARSLLKVIECTPHVQAGTLTTLDLYPLTGRRHQLRRHCAQLGVPICGDDLYATKGGFAGKKSAGLFLQSVEVALPHPADDGSWVNVKIPEASKFRRQRERAALGWAYQVQRVNSGRGAAHLSPSSRPQPDANAVY
jgi:23S rRNA-/tRNA-specific pseudouridylate synthase